MIGFEPIQPKQQIYSLPRLSNFGASPSYKVRASGGIRTPDPLITNQLLWPTELHWRLSCYSNFQNAKWNFFQKRCKIKSILDNTKYFLRFF